MSYMKSEFDKIIEAHGHYVYLQRSTVDNDGKITYRKNDAGKWVLEKVKVRHRGFNSALPNVANELPEGQVNTSERTYYFKSEVIPFENDRIYEEDLRAEIFSGDESQGKYTVWTIDSALPLRGAGGDIDYWVCGVTRTRPN